MNFPVVRQVRAVGFDLDGTLVDSVPDLSAAVNAMLVGRGLAPLSADAVARLIGRGVEQLIGDALYVSAGAAATPPQLSDSLEMFSHYYHEHLFERSHIYPGVIEGLIALVTRGLPLCCLTNKLSQFTVPLLQRAGLAQYFDFTLCADQPEQRKPAPAMLMMACRRLGIGPHELLYVGDSRFDIAAARAAGCPVAVVDYGYDSRAELSALQPDEIIGSLAALTALPATQLS